jgi:hypothetical protein
VCTVCGSVMVDMRGAGKSRGLKGGRIKNAESGSGCASLIRCNRGHRCNPSGVGIFYRSAAARVSISSFADFLHRNSFGRFFTVDFCLIFLCLQCIFCEDILSYLKGTVWPDWICIRVVSLESPLKGHQLL